jgi:plastocyanin
MPVQHRAPASTLWTALAAAALPFVAGGAWAAASSPQYMVSQLGRTFQPRELTIRRGDSVQFVNDDGDLLHHAYVESDSFNFDSGDLKPGSKTNVNFPTAGRFLVLCAIHPKMKLIVHVQ